MQHENGAYVLQKAVLRLKQKAEPLAGDRSLLQFEDVGLITTQRDYWDRGRLARNASQVRN